MSEDDISNNSKGGSKQSSSRKDNNKSNIKYTQFVSKNSNSKNSSKKNLNIINNENIICNRTNFHISSNPKRFNQNLLIEKTSIDFNNIENKQKKKNIKISNTGLFIGGNQSLKAMRLHLANNLNMNYNNIVKRNIYYFKNKNKSADKIKTNIIINEQIDKENNDEIKDKLRSKENIISNKISECDILKAIGLRWEKNLNKANTQLSYLNKENYILKQEQKYKQELLNELNFDSDIGQNYMLIKKNSFNKKNKISFRKFSPKSKEEAEICINEFYDNVDNEDIDRKSSNSSVGNKKKSKFSQIKNEQNKKWDNDEQNIKKGQILILNEQEIKNLYEKIKE